MPSMAILVVVVLAVAAAAATRHQSFFFRLSGATLLLLFGSREAVSAADTRLISWLRGSLMSTYAWPSSNECG